MRVHFAMTSILPYAISLCVLNTTVAMAQTSADGSDESAPDAIEEIVVTGSRIQQRMGSVSPIVTLSEEKFEEQGAVRIEQVLNRMPQVIAAPNATSAGSTGNRTQGTSQVDLRGLGPERTLVLMNGRRLPYGSPRHIAADVNQIPLILLESVEILTGGASAVYGSDALAGVVNFKLKNNLDGFRVRTNLSMYQHSNDNEMIRDVVAPWEAGNPGEYTVPGSSGLDGATRELSIAFGHNLADDRGNITMFGTWRKMSEVLMAERDFTTCQLGIGNSEGTTYNCRPSPVDAPATFVNLSAAGLPSEFRVLDGQFVARDGFTDTFNDQQFGQAQRPEEQHAFGALAHVTLNDHLVPYVEATFNHTKTLGSHSPGAILNQGIIPDAGGLNCDNPFFSEQQADFLCTSRGLSTASDYDPATGAYLGPESIATGIVMNRRTVENSHRDDEVQFTSYRIAAGLRGELAGPFDYDISAIYGTTALERQYNDTANSRAIPALFAVIDQRVEADGSPVDPTTFGQPVCAVNADASPFNDSPNCAPLDYFSPDGPSQQAVDFIASRQFNNARASMSNVIASVDADLEQYGLISPFTDAGVGVAFGAEYRKQSLVSVVDDEQVLAGGDESINGSFDVREYFGEVNVPLASDRPFLERLSLESAYRKSDYSNGIETDTYKFGVNWAPVSDIQFRGSFQHAVRAANILELFAGQSRGVTLQLAQNSDGSFDPCAGTTPFASFEECARTGVTEADYGNIVDNSFVGRLDGGNPDLRPEKGDTYVFGVVFQPSFVPELTASIDYYNIQIEDLVGTIDPAITLSECMGTGDPTFCSLIQRGEGGTLFATQDSYIQTTIVNVGSLEVSGFDVSVNYPFDLPSVLGREAGSLTVNMIGSYLDEYVTRPLPTSTPEQTFDCAGYHGFACGRPKPEWRHNLQFAWDTPWPSLWLALTWRYMDAVDIARASTQPALSGPAFPVQNIASRSFLDLSARWSAGEHLEIRGGVNNLFDKGPPLTTETSAINGGLGNTYPGFWDNKGRQLFLSASFEF
jgi:iron complex outermembrane recepter protein